MDVIISRAFRVLIIPDARALGGFENQDGHH